MHQLCVQAGWPRTTPHLWPSLPFKKKMSGMRHRLSISSHDGPSSRSDIHPPHATTALPGPVRSCRTPLKLPTAPLAPPCPALRPGDYAAVHQRHSACARRLQRDHSLSASVVPCAGAVPVPCVVFMPVCCHQDRAQPASRGSSHAGTSRSRNTIEGCVRHSSVGWSGPNLPPISTGSRPRHHATGPRATAEPTVAAQLRAYVSDLRRSFPVRRRGCAEASRACHSTTPVDTRTNHYNDATPGTRHGQGARRVKLRPRRQS